MADPHLYSSWPAVSRISCSKYNNASWNLNYFSRESQTFLLGKLHCLTCSTYTCALSCADVFLCAPILIHKLFSYYERTFSENHSAWRVMTSYKRFLFLLDNLCYSCNCLAPPQLAFQLFVGQNIQLLYFCTKNKDVVVVFVVALLPVQLTNATVSLHGQFTYMKPKTVHYLLLGKAISYFCVTPITVILNTFNAVPCLAQNFCPILMAATKKTQIYNIAVSRVDLIFKYCTLRMKTWNTVNFFLIRKAWTMPERTDAFSWLCFLLEHMQQILFLMGNQFSCHTYLPNKFLTMWFDYSPWFSLLLICLTSKVLLQKPPFLLYLTQFLLVLSLWLPNYHAYIVAIEFGCPTIHTRTTRVKRGIINYCLEYGA